MFESDTVSTPVSERPQSHAAETVDETFIQNTYDKRRHTRRQQSKQSE